MEATNKRARELQDLAQRFRDNARATWMPDYAKLMLQTADEIDERRLEVLGVPMRPAPSARQYSFM